MSVRAQAMERWRWVLGGGLTECLLGETYLRDGAPLASSVMYSPLYFSNDYDRFCCSKISPRVESRNMSWTHVGEG